MAERSTRTTAAQQPWYRPMTARDQDEEHRAATPLELFFDLCFVVAVALTAAELHHAVTENHVGQGVLSYVLLFFAIWWAWMNFTWFASAYDTDDVLYRVTTLVQMTGALILAAGVPAAFESDNFTVIVIGYVVMRLAMVAQWLRCAYTDPSHRASSLRFAIGITVVQVLWIARLSLPGGLLLPGFAVLAVAELLIPVWAERAAPTPWNPEHITERYGLFTLIVLGESVLAATTAIEQAYTSGQHLGELLALAGAGLVIVFSMWWLYFDHPGAIVGTSLRWGIIWGYGHLLIFGSAAAVGAGIQVAVDFESDHAEIPAIGAALATTIPVAIYLLSVWVLHVRPRRRGLGTAAFPVVAVAVLATSLTSVPIHLTAVLLFALVVINVVTTRSARSC